MKNFIILPLLTSIALTLAGCTVTNHNKTPLEDITTDNQLSQYDMNSWKEIIPDSCQSFYDGCNHCNKMGSGEAACTKMYCEIYTEPYCKDEENVQVANPASEFCIAQGWSITLSGSVGYCNLPTGESIEEWEFYRANNIHTSKDIYIGLSMDEATVEASKRGVPFRVVEIDGESQMVTEDFRPGRINAVVNNGFITSFSIEGSTEIM